ncbi:MAG: protein kinase [Cyanobacteriota bacterium]|nr:protein kinase [Cyanobacteriota bacterium]
MLGTVLRDRYEIIRFLGRGGFGQTYLARDRDLPGQPECVVKRLFPQSQAESVLQTARRLFETEAQTLYRLGSHDRIPQLLAHFEVGGEFYLVQQLVLGSDLKQEWRQGKLWREAEAIAFLSQMLPVLDFIHQQGIIHRDIKPSNIIRRTGDRALVLIDFGAVKQVGTQSGTDFDPDNLTVAVGTAGYMPNEQAAGKPRSSSDLYALGMVAIRGLTGVSPHQLPEDPRTNEVLWREVLPRDGNFSGAFLDILTQLVRYNPRDRYANAAEVLAALASIAGEGEIDLTQPPLTRSQPTQAQLTPAQLTSVQTPQGQPSDRHPPDADTIFPPSSPTPLSATSYRYRQILLNKVRNYWIKGVLETSLHDRAAIELGLEERNDLVDRPWGLVWQGTDTTPQTLPSGVRVSDKFREMGSGRSLLILGEPGSGKTTTLLEVARDLLAIAETNANQPLPVIFNLSSWQGKSSISAWLATELNRQYQVSREIGRNWVKDGRLLLLLDGLDEVRADLRENCIAALNRFGRSHGTTEIIACSRIRDYQALKARLTLQAAVCLQPLTLSQIQTYLENAGSELAGVRRLLGQEVALQELAKSPLILNIITLAYRGMSPDSLPKIPTLEAQRQHLFDTYIRRMFDRRSQNTRRYSKERALHWLIWLAKSMSGRSQTIFLIERMQPSWLTESWQKWVYRLAAIALFFLCGFSIGSLVLSMQRLTVVLPFSCFMFWLIFGFERIEPVETLKWSWKKARKYLILGIGIGTSSLFLLKVIYEIIFHPLHWQILTSWASFPTYALIRGAVFGLSMGTLFGITRGMTGSVIPKATRPNQGIWQSGKNALVFASIGFTVLSLAAIPLQWLPLFWGTFGASFGMAIGGGAACVKHLILRSILTCSGATPWHYARFLDYATDRIFLQKVGGGYIFIHRLLLEHFAAMNPKNGRTRIL